MVAQKERVIGTIIYEQRFCAPFALPIEINVVNGILKGNRDLLPHFGGGSLGWGGISCPRIGECEHKLKTMLERICALDLR